METKALPVKLTNALPLITGLAWGGMVIVSILPEVLFQELTGELPSWLRGAKLAGLALLAAASLVRPGLRPLRTFCFAIAALLAFDWALQRTLAATGWERWLAGSQPFVRDLLRVQGPRFSLALLMTGLLWLLHGRRERFYLRLGNLAARAEPIPLMMVRPNSWRVLGPFLSVALPGGLMMFMLAFGQMPSAARLVAALPLAPWVLLFAAMNAYGEELTYRAMLLSGLEPALGPRQALLISAVFFGIMHYYGMPYGVLGVAMSAAVGWLMGKAMLETRGFFWAWCIHMCLDIAAFMFIAMGTVRPGG